MQRITGNYLPNSLDTEEKQLVFSYFAIKSASSSGIPTNALPTFFLENESVYQRPVCNDRIVLTPNHGMRLIITIAIPISPAYGINANGLWNHVLQMAPDFIPPL